MRALICERSTTTSIDPLYRLRRDRFESEPRHVFPDVTKLRMSRRLLGRPLDARRFERGEGGETTEQIQHHRLVDDRIHC